MKQRQLITLIIALFRNQHAVLMGVILVLAGFLAGNVTGCRQVSFFRLSGVNIRFSGFLGIIFGVWFALRESTKEFHIHQQ